MGRTRTNHIVNFMGDARPGDVVFASITKAHTNSLEGELAAPQQAAPTRLPVFSA
jgi:tRNA A37 methylthiotransferase MiaB